MDEDGKRYTWRGCEKRWRWTGPAEIVLAAADRVDPLRVTERAMRQQQLDDEHNDFMRELRRQEFENRRDGFARMVCGP